MTENGEQTSETESEILEHLGTKDANTESQDGSVPLSNESHLVTETTCSDKSEVNEDNKDESEVNKEEQKAEVNQQDRDKILDTSLHLFANKGVYQTSLVDISVTAELSKTYIYKHFQNKEAIADALQSDLSERLDQTLIDIHENNNTSIACLRSIVEFLLDLTEQAPDVARLLFCPKDFGLMSHNQGAESFPGFHQMLTILEAGMNAGELERIDPKLAYCSFMGILSRVISLYLDGLLPGTLDQYTNDVWYPIWRALGKNPNRPN